MYFTDIRDKVRELSVAIDGVAQCTQERMTILEGRLEQIDFILRANNINSEEITNWRVDCDSMAGFRFLTKEEDK